MRVTYKATCPVCKREVRVNKDGTLRAHYGTLPGPTYCPGSRERAR